MSQGAGIFFLILEKDVSDPNTTDVSRMLGKITTVMRKAKWLPDEGLDVVYFVKIFSFQLIIL